MKHLFRYIAVVTLLSNIAACSEGSDEALVPVGEQVNVTFETTLPSTARAGDGSLATELHYAVYFDERTDYSTGTAPIVGGSAQLTLALISGENYDIVFWAQAPNAPYTLDWENEQILMNYGTTTTGNNEARDAFIYVLTDYSIDGAAKKNIPLKRPFAQLNIGVSDEAASIAAGFTPASTSITAQSYDALSLFGLGGDEYGIPTGSLQEITFGWATPLTGDDATIEILGVTYKYMAMDYLLVGANSLHSDLLDIEVAFNDATDGSGVTKVVPVFTSVPVERNHRTNIIGSLLTSASDRNYVVNP